MLTPLGDASIALYPYAQHWRRWQRSLTLNDLSKYCALHAVLFLTEVYNKIL